MPSSSGPRCTILSVMRRTCSAVIVSPSRPTMPAIPHIVAPQGFHCLHSLLSSGLDAQPACGRKRQLVAGLLVNLRGRNLRTSEILLRTCASIGTTESTSQTYRARATEGLCEKPWEWHRPTPRWQSGRQRELCARPDGYRRAESRRNTACAKAWVVSGA